MEDIESTHLRDERNGDDCAVPQKDKVSRQPMQESLKSVKLRQLEIPQVATPQHKAVPELVTLAFVIDSGINMRRSAAKMMTFYDCVRLAIEQLLADESPLWGECREHKRLVQLLVLDGGDRAAVDTASQQEGDSRTPEDACFLHAKWLVDLSARCTLFRSGYFMATRDQVKQQRYLLVQGLKRVSPCGGSNVLNAVTSAAFMTTSVHPSDPPPSEPVRYYDSYPAGYSAARDPANLLSQAIVTVITDTTVAADERSAPALPLYAGLRKMPNQARVFASEGFGVPGAGGVCSAGIFVSEKAAPRQQQQQQQQQQQPFGMHDLLSWKQTINAVILDGERERVLQTMSAPHPANRSVLQSPLGQLVLRSGGRVAFLGYNNVTSNSLQEPSAPPGAFAGAPLPGASPASAVLFCQNILLNIIVRCAKPFFTARIEVVPHAHQGSEADFDTFTPPPRNAGAAQQASPPIAGTAVFTKLGGFSCKNVAVSAASADLLTSATPELLISAEAPPGEAPLLPPDAQQHPSALPPGSECLGDAGNAFRQILLNGFSQQKPARRAAGKADDRGADSGEPQQGAAQQQQQAHHDIASQALCDPPLSQASTQAAEECTTVPLPGRYWPLPPLRGGSAAELFSDEVSLTLTGSSLDACARRGVFDAPGDLYVLEEYDVNRAPEGGIEALPAEPFFQQMLRALQAGGADRCYLVTRGGGGGGGSGSPEFGVVYCDTGRARPWEAEDAGEAAMPARLVLRVFPPVHHLAAEAVRGQRGGAGSGGGPQTAQGVTRWVRRSSPVYALAAWYFLPSHSRDCCVRIANEVVPEGGPGPQLAPLAAVAARASATSLNAVFANTRQSMLRAPPPPPVRIAVSRTLRTVLCVDKMLPLSAAGDAGLEAAFGTGALAASRGSRQGRPARWCDVVSGETHLAKKLLLLRRSHTEGGTPPVEDTGLDDDLHHMVGCVEALPCISGDGEVAFDSYVKVYRRDYSDRLGRARAGGRSLLRPSAAVHASVAQRLLHTDALNPAHNLPVGAMQDYVNHPPRDTPAEAQLRDPQIRKRPACMVHEAERAADRSKYRKLKPTALDRFMPPVEEHLAASSASYASTAPYSGTPLGHPAPVPKDEVELIDLT